MKKTLEILSVFLLNFSFIYYQLGKEYLLIYVYSLTRWVRVSNLIARFVQKFWTASRAMRRGGRKGKWRGKSEREIVERECAIRESLGWKAKRNDRRWRKVSVVAKWQRARIVPRKAEEATGRIRFFLARPWCARYWMLCRDDSASDSRTCSPLTKTIIPCQKSCYVNAPPVLGCRSEVVATPLDRGERILTTVWLSQWAELLARFPSVSIGFVVAVCDFQGIFHL